VICQEDQLPSASPIMLPACERQQRVAPPAADAGPVLLDVAVCADDELLRILQQDRAARPVVALDKNAAAFVTVGSGTGPNGSMFTPELPLRLDVLVTRRRKNGAASGSSYRLVILVKVFIWSVFNG
jgi:hypothetical protein